MMKPLTPYGCQAEKHWREFCPKRVAELQATGQWHARRLPDHPDSKVNRAVAEIERIWRETLTDLPLPMTPMMRK